MAPRGSNGRLTAELRAEWLRRLRTEPRVRRWLEREVENWRVRARPDFVPPEKLAQLEAVVAREHEHVCVACGDPFTSASPDARYCPGGACKQRAYRRRLREAMAA